MREYAEHQAHDVHDDRGRGARRSGPIAAHGDGDGAWPFSPAPQLMAQPVVSDGRAGLGLEEPAWQAARALQGVGSDELYKVLRQPAFRRMPPDVLVPVSPCPVCADGALRTAGTLQTSLGRLLVRACDTCGLVDLDPRLIACH
jgi:hypothetical protein